MTIEAMKQALEAFEWNLHTDLNDIRACEQWAKMLKKNITALRAAIEQAELIQRAEEAFAASEQKPVAWMLEWEIEDEEDGEEPERKLYESERRCRMDAKRDGGVCKPLYLAPSQRQWFGLTDEEAAQIWDGVIKYAPGEVRVKDFARAIEAKLKEKNG